MESGERKQSASTYPLFFWLIASSDHITGLTGKAGSVVVSISKNGASGVTPSGTISEVDAVNQPGRYMISGVGLATDTNILGELSLHAKDAASDPFDCSYDIVGYDPFAAQVAVSSLAGSSVQSWVSICNTAIARCGISSRIINLQTDNSKASNLCLASYESCRDAVLEGWDWNFASTRAILTQSSIPPVWGYSHQYILPSNCLVIRDVHPGSSWKVEGRMLLTHFDNTDCSLKARYTASITDPTVIPSLCAKAMAWRIAAEICPSLVNIQNLQASIMKEYMMIIEEAQSANQYSQQDHNMDVPWHNFNGVFRNGVYVGLDMDEGEMNRLMASGDDWVQAGTWEATH